MNWLSIILAVVAGLCAALLLKLSADFRKGQFSSQLQKIIPSVLLTSGIGLSVFLALPMAFSAWICGGVFLAAVPCFRLCRQRLMNLQRRSQLSREIPTFLDSLVLRTEAGLALVPSIVETAEIFPPESPVKQEILRFTKDLELGKGAADALREMKLRMGVPSSDSSIGALVRSLEMGTPVRRVLREQSERARQTLLTEAERFSNTLSLKLMLPLVLFIFPASFLVILSPVLVALLGNRQW